jgi:hypothetical protein
VNGNEEKNKQGELGNKEVREKLMLWNKEAKNLEEK